MIRRLVCMIRAHRFYATLYTDAGLVFQPLDHCRRCGITLAEFDAS